MIIKPIIKFLRFSWGLLSVLSLVLFSTVRGVSYASPVSQESEVVTAQIAGPLQLDAFLSPAVNKPGDPLTLLLRLTNHDPLPAGPELIIGLPTTLSIQSNLLPAGTFYNYQANTLSWMPIVPAGESIQEITFHLVASVADLTNPEQLIGLTLKHNGQEASSQMAFWVGLAPQATITANPSIAAVGQPVQLMANAIGPGPFSQHWLLSDGRQIYSNDPIVAFAMPGTYQITLTIANPLGETTLSSTITIVAQPTAAFSLDDARPVLYQPVQFINQSGGQPPLTFLWDFGDGLGSTDAHPSHQYTAPGLYVVRLYVQSQFGEAISEMVIEVGNEPMADFTMPQTAVTGQPVGLQAFTDGSVSQIQWDMGDGTIYEGPTVNHTYYNTGEFVVTMIASNSYGERWISHAIQIGPGIFSTFLPIVAHDATPSVNLPNPEPPTTDPLLEGPGEASPTTVIDPNSQAVAPEAPTNFVAIELPPQTPLPAGASPAEQLLWYINEARRLHGLPPLAYNYALTIAAQQHTDDISLHPGLVHDGSDGSRPFQRQQWFGYGGFYGGEAVAWGWENVVPVVEFWVNSPPHRALILNPNATDVGVGFTANGNAPNIWYWTAEFGIHDPNNSPTSPQPN